MIGRRGAGLTGLLFACLILVYHFNPGIVPWSSPNLGPMITLPLGEVKVKKRKSHLNYEVLNYFEQAFSLGAPEQYDFKALHHQCQIAPQQREEVYLQCVGMIAGLTSIMSSLKVCFKMATEIGAGIVLPTIPLRDSHNLMEYNFMNKDAYLNYDQWFDAEHLITQLRRVCPQMKVLYPDQLDSNTPDGVLVKSRWEIKLHNAVGYRENPFPFFWPGMPFRAFFQDQYMQLCRNASLDPNTDHVKVGATVITINSPFLLFRITDDPTGHDLRLWNDLGMLIRFRENQREIIYELLAKMNRPWYGVHFRAENDSLWSSTDKQLAVNLNALDKAWAIYGNEGEQKPLVYIACGDHEQVQKFVQEGSLRGWEVTHKWALAEGNKTILKMINDLPFDFQGAVDIGIIVKSDFFLGITGSALSSTVANVRDKTGRYRGSSFMVHDDENARTHLFNDGNNIYPCCL